MDNKKIAEVFSEIADILEIQGESIFRINAYRKGALMILNLGADLRDLVEKDPKAILEIPGIGKDLQKKIIELIETGRCEEYERLKKKFPEGLLSLLRIRGVGPKKVKLFYAALKIKNLKDLKAAAKKHLIRDLEGMGEKSEEDILKALEEYKSFSPDRFLISEAGQEAERIIDYLKKCTEIKKIECAGSLRRMQETIGDLDILVTAKDMEESYKKVMEHFTKYREVLNVIASGDTKSTVILESGMHVDLRLVDDKCFGAALHYFTGNKEHNIAIRDLAKKKGLKISEYGVFKGEKLIGGKEEKDIFNAVGLPFIIPEIRQGDFEIEYGLKYGKFPKFVKIADIKGDLHMHSNYSDGDNSVEEMALACIKKGYEYMGISDHSSIIGITGGMGSKDIKEQWKEVDALNKKLKGKFKIFKSCEVDILKDGSLDFSDEILNQLDYVIISAHMYSKLTEAEQTGRLITAIESPYAAIFAHPTMRLINQRPEMKFDMEKIISACVANNVALEINSNPLRLDLAEKYLKIGRAMGAKFVINTDAHAPDQLEFMKFGIGMARRGWLTQKHILNTASLKDLTLKKRAV